jgi:hypothetical protein
MIGLPFNPDNCLFVANQAVNANQFNGVVPNASNTSNHTVLWDFIDSKIYWVNTLTNIIEREIDGLGGIQNESYQISSSSNTYYTVNLTPTVYSNNYLLLPAGTYMFDLEFDIYPFDEEIERARAPIVAEIRTNTNQAIVNADVSDIVRGSREVSARYIGSTIYPIDFENNPQIFNQTVVSKIVTFNAPAVVKSCFYLDSTDPIAAEAINNIQLRAFLVK